MIAKLSAAAAAALTFARPFVCLTASGRGRSVYRSLACLLTWRFGAEQAGLDTDHAHILCSGKPWVETIRLLIDEERDLSST